MSKVKPSTVCTQSMCFAPEWVTVLLHLVWKFLIKKCLSSAFDDLYACMFYKEVKLGDEHTLSGAFMPRLLPLLGKPNSSGNASVLCNYYLFYLVFWPHSFNQLNTNWICKFIFASFLFGVAKQKMDCEVYSHTQMDCEVYSLHWTGGSICI